METKKTPVICVDIPTMDGFLKDPLFEKVKQDAAGRELVLFLGTTGVGKSTCISYLLGTKFDQVKHKGRYCAVASADQAASLDVRNLPEISSHLYRSCTIYSQIFHDAFAGIDYCDTAGFIDTRYNYELEICASLHMQYAIQSAKHIKAIVVVMEWGIFQHTITNTLQSLMRILSQLLVAPESVAESMVFLINKAPEDADEQDFAALVSDYKKTIERDLAQLNEKTRQDELSEKICLNEAKTIVDLLDAQIKKRPEQVIFINVFDDGQTRRIMQERLHCLRMPITQEKFNFRTYNEKRKVFDRDIELILPLLEAYNEEKKIQETSLTAGNSHDCFCIAEDTTGNLDVVDSKLFGDYQKEPITPLIVEENRKKIVPVVEKTTDHIGHSNTPADAKITPHCSEVPQKDITPLLRNLVETADPLAAPTTLSEKFDNSPTTLLITPRQNSEVDTAQVDTAPSALFNSSQVFGILMAVFGVAVGLFALFLLVMGAGALANWSFAASLIQQIFQESFDKSVVCAFAYASASILVAFVALSVASMMCYAQQNETHMNDIEDIGKIHHQAVSLPDTQPVHKNHTAFLSTQTSKGFSKQNPSNLSDNQSPRSF